MMLPIGRNDYGRQRRPSWAAKPAELVKVREYCEQYDVGYCGTYRAALTIENFSMKPWGRDRTGAVEGLPNTMEATGQAMREMSVCVYTILDTSADR